MFSIVIPLYNKELSIKSTIESVLNQSFQDFEIIVINDGSTDSSAKIVEKINDDRIRLIHQENQGVSAARNSGVKEACSKWIAFLDSDDLWEKNHLEEINKMMCIFPDEKIYVTSFEYSDNRKLFKHSREKSIFKVENYFKEALHEKLICTDVIVINQTCFDKVGFFNENLNRGEDLDLWSRLACEYSIVKSNKITAVYNIEDKYSLSKGKSEYDKSVLSIINLKDKKSYERKYFKKMLFYRMKLDLKTFDIKGLARILIRHNFELLR